MQGKRYPEDKSIGILKEIEAGASIATVDRALEIDADKEPPERKW
jgi:hypothetical protein